MSNRATKSIFLVFGCALLASGGGIVLYYLTSPPAVITSFDECVRAGYPVLESYPLQCSTPDGRTFVEGTVSPLLEENDNIRVISPAPNEVVGNPIIIKGEARGTWYFEASFPVVLLDENGKEIAVMPLQAEGEWMTKEFVPFSGELAFTPPETKKGTLVFKKDNPSGLPEHDDEVRVPIVFQEGLKSEVRIMATYDDKIVYTMDSKTEKALLRADCNARRGTFNECGSMCPEGTGICPAVCAMTCEMIPPALVSEETMKIQLYFTDDISNECEKTTPVERIIPKTPSVARAALSELFVGPKKGEIDQGVSSPFSQKTKSILKDIIIQNNTAYVHLVDIRSLIPSVNSRCGSAQFMAEIEDTLKQFSSIKKVVYAINGSTRTFYEWMQIGCTVESNNCDDSPFGG